ESVAIGCCLDDAQRFMAKNQALLTRRSKAVASVEDFAIGPTHPEGQGAYQNGAIGRRRFRDFLEPRRAGDTGQNGDCTHRCFALPRLRSRRRPRELIGAPTTPALRARMPYLSSTQDGEKCFFCAGRRKMFRRIETKTGLPALSISRETRVD